MQAGWLAYMLAGKQAGKQEGSQVGRHAVRLVGRKAGRQADRHAGRKADRQALLNLFVSSTTGTIAEWSHYCVMFQIINPAEETIHGQRQER